MHTTPAPGLPGFEGLIERFDHVAVATCDIRSMLPLVTLLEGRFRNGGESSRGFRWAQWYLPGTAKIELLEPLDPSDGDHFLVRFLAGHGSGVHHLTFKVHDLTAAVGHAESLGYEVVGARLDRPHWKEAFLHPRSAHGVLIQLAEWTDRDAPPGVTIETVLGGLPEGG